MIVGLLALAANTVSVPISRPFDYEQSQATIESTSKQNASTPKYELAASTWAPDAFQLESRVAGAARFQSSMPEVTFSRINKLRDFGWSVVDWKAGVGFLAMTRESASLLATPADSQSVFLFPVTIGAEVHPAMVKTAIISPYLGASLLPTLAVANRSVFGDGSTVIGLPFQVSIGTSVAASRLSENLEFDFAVIRSFGKVSDSSFSGTGLQAGVRFVTF